MTETTETTAAEPQSQTYRGYKIYYAAPPIPPSAGADWHFAHPDADDCDRREGHGPTAADCREQVDEQIAERVFELVAAGDAEELERLEAEAGRAAVRAARLEAWLECAGEPLAARTEREAFELAATLGIDREVAAAAWRRFVGAVEPPPIASRREPVAGALEPNVAEPIAEALAPFRPGTAPALVAEVLEELAAEHAEAFRLAVDRLHRAVVFLVTSENRGGPGLVLEDDQASAAVVEAIARKIAQDHPDLESGDAARMVDELPTLSIY